MLTPSLARGGRWRGRRSPEGVMVQQILRPASRPRRSPRAMGYPVARPVGAVSPREAAHAKDRTPIETRQ